MFEIVHLNNKVQDEICVEFLTNGSLEAISTACCCPDIFSKELPVTTVQITLAKNKIRRGKIWSSSDNSHYNNNNNNSNR